MIGTALVRPQAPAHLEPVELRQHQVEHDEIDLLRRRTAASASSPSRACMTRKPSCSSGYVRSFCTASSSSTSRMVAASGVAFSRETRPADRRPTIDRRGSRPACVRGRRAAATGSLDRPVNGRLYRGTWLARRRCRSCARLQRRAACGSCSAEPAAARSTRTRCARARRPSSPSATRAGSPGTPGAAAPRAGSRDQLRALRLHRPVRTVHAPPSPGRAACALLQPRGGEAGLSQTTIVVVAHRDDTGVGPGANDNASGTAALLELARAYAPATPAPPVAHASVHTLLFLSTDGAASAASAPRGSPRTLPRPGRHCRRSTSTRSPAPRRHASSSPAIRRARRRRTSARRPRAASPPTPGPAAAHSSRSGSSSTSASRSCPYEQVPFVTGGSRR